MMYLLFIGCFSLSKSETFAMKEQSAAQSRLKEQSMQNTQWMNNFDNTSSGEDTGYSDEESDGSYDGPNPSIPYRCYDGYFCWESWNMNSNDCDYVLGDNATFAMDYCPFNGIQSSCANVSFGSYYDTGNSSDYDGTFFQYDSQYIDQSDCVYDFNGDWYDSE